MGRRPRTGAGAGAGGRLRSRGLVLLLLFLILAAFTQVRAAVVRLRTGNKLMERLKQLLPGTRLEDHHIYSLTSGVLSGMQGYEIAVEQKGVEKIVIDDIELGVTSLKLNVHRTNSGLAVQLLSDPNLAVRLKVRVVWAKGASLLGLTMRALTRDRVADDLRCTIPIGFKGVDDGEDYPLLRFELNYETRSVTGSAFVGPGTDGLRTETNLRFPSVANFAARGLRNPSASDLPQWTFGFPIDEETPTYGVCDSTALGIGSSVTSEYSLGAILRRKIETKFVVPYSTITVQNFAKAFAENPCVQSELVRGTRSMPADGLRASLALKLDEGPDALVFNASVPNANEWIGDAIGIEVPASLGLAGRYRTRTDSVQIELIAPTGQTDRILNRAIRTMMNWGLETAGSGGVQRNHVGTFVDTLSALQRGWATLSKQTLAATSALPVRAAVPDPVSSLGAVCQHLVDVSTAAATAKRSVGSDGTNHLEHIHAVSGILLDVFQKAIRQVAVGDHDSAAEVPLPRRTVRQENEDIIADGSTGSSSSTSAPEWAPATVSEALPGIRIPDSVLPEQFLNGFEMPEDSLTIKALGIKKVKILGVSIRRLNFVLDTSYSQNSDRFRLALVPAPVTSRDAATNVCAACLSRPSVDGVEPRFCVFKPNEKGRLPTPFGDCRTTDTLDMSACASVLAPTDIGGCPSFPLRLSVVLKIDSIRVGKGASFKYPLAVDVNVPFATGTPLASMEFEKMPTARFLSGITGDHEPSSPQGDGRVPQSRCNKKAWCVASPARCVVRKSTTAVPISYKMGSSWKSAARVMFCPAGAFTPEGTPECPRVERRVVGCIKIFKSEGSESHVTFQATAMVHQTLDWLRKNGVPGVWKKRFHSNRYNVLRFQYAGPDDDVAHASISLSGKSDRLFQGPGSPLLTSIKSALDPRHFTQDLGICTDDSDSFLERTPRGNCEDMSQLIQSATPLNRGEIVWEQRPFNCIDQCTYTGCCMSDILSSVKEPCAMCACIWPEIAKCYFSKRLFCGKRASTCEKLKTAQAKLNRDYVNSVPSGRKGDAVFKTPLPPQQLAFVPDPNIVLEGIVSFRPYSRSRIAGRHLKTHWAVLRRCNQLDRNGATLTLFRMDARWQAALPQRSRVYAHKYHFFFNSRPDIKLGRPGAFSIMGGGHLADAEDQTVSAPLGVFSVYVDGWDDEANNGARQLWVDAINSATNSGRCLDTSNDVARTQFVYTRKVGSSIDSRKHPHVIAARPFWGPHVAEVMSTITRVVPKDDEARQNVGFTKTSVLSNFNEEKGMLGKILDTFGVTRTSLMDWFALGFGRTALASATAFLARDPCFQHILLGHADAIIPNLELAGDSLGFQLGFHYKSSIDGDTERDEVAADIRTDAIGAGWSLCPEHQCEYDASIEYKDASNVEVRLVPQNRESDLSSFLTDWAPRALNQSASHMRGLAGFYGLLSAAFTRAFSEESDTLDRFYLEMLTPDLRNSFFDSWDGNYQMAANEVFVVPISQARAKHVCRDFFADPGNTNEGTPSDVSSSVSSERSSTRLTSAVIRGRGGYNPGAQVPGGVHFDLEDEDLGFASDE